VSGKHRIILCAKMPVLLRAAGLIRRTRALRGDFTNLANFSVLGLTLGLPPAVDPEECRGFIPLSAQTGLPHWLIDGNLSTFG
jgi:hypothetical protein